MKEIILAKYGEMVLKGLNKNGFEDILLKNIRRRLKPLGSFTYAKAQSTIYITPAEEDVLEDAMERLGKGFGIAALCRALDLADVEIVQVAVTRTRNTWRRCCPVPVPLRWRQSGRTRRFP